MKKFKAPALPPTTARPKRVIRHTRPVRIDDEVYAELGKRARAFEHPNDTLRRVLGLKP